MNSGFMSLWIMTVMFILMATGWSDWVGINYNKKKIAIIVISCAVFQLIPGHITIGYLDIQFQFGAILAMLLALIVMRGPLMWDSKYYLLVCALLAGMILGSIRKMYNIDPVFFWVNPMWDAPILGGLLAAAFSIKAHHQFAVLLFSAAISEIVYALMLSGGYSAHIGSLSWWDGFWLSYASARIISVGFNLIRIVIQRFLSMPWRNRGGSTPK